ncbi:hypothetical protein SO078_29585 (plasmid) [Sinorhizobium meliloti]|uniref:hypothetical protein n=1 Tax=Rhizobium meliloti TaxID=382 RepID=UPI002D76C0A7|nr:hypothetical protein [Sinorhizobium meliloti]WRQ71848.1 hypothetical protein SO078_29585 [Sinorhizobium meliloti]
MIAAIIGIARSEAGSDRYSLSLRRDLQSDADLPRPWHRATSLAALRPKITFNFFHVLELKKKEDVQNAVLLEASRLMETLEPPRQKRPRKP